MRGGPKFICALVGLAGLLAAGNAATERSRTPAARDSAQGGAELRPAPAASRAGFPVRASRVEHGPFVHRIEAEGRAVPLRRATLRVEGAGTVRVLSVREGDRVEQGRLLLRLDTARASLRLRAARADLERARLDYRALTLDDRALGLDSAALARRRRNARIRAGVDRAEAELALAAAERRGRDLRAPFAGRVAGLAVVPGARLAPGDSVGALLDQSRVVVEAELLEEEAVEVDPGAPAEVRFLSHPGRPCSGLVTAVSPVVERAGGRVRVTLLLDRGTPHVRSGAFAAVSVAARSHPSELLVPDGAVVFRGDRHVVFLFRPEAPGASSGTASWVYVEVLRSDGSLAAIRPVGEAPGLVPGAAVLVAGHELLAHGARVELEGLEDPEPTL